MKTSLLLRIIYFIVLTSLSGLVLVVFLRPTEQHVGINQYSRAKFLDMVEGKAHRPFVSRTLLPTTVRLVSLLAPNQYKQACADLVEQHDLTRRAFGVFGWESQSAFQYLLASVLMFLCFIGFGHCIVRLTERVCDTPETGLTRLLLVAGALVGLPPFFRYTSYPYDPAQLFLFTLALYFLADHNSKMFCIAFVACCLNKETAVLLIPLYGLTFHNRYTSHQRYWGTMLGLVVVYISIESALAWVFRSNPGAFVEFHLAHNVGWLTAGWTFTGLVVFLIIAALVLFRWSEKPAFLRWSFLCVLLPLGTLALFLGFVDEWRGYYEVYPIAFGLIVHSLLWFNDVFRRNREIVQTEDPVDVE